MFFGEITTTYVIWTNIHHEMKKKKKEKKKNKYLCHLSGLDFLDYLQKLISHSNNRLLIICLIHIQLEMH